MPGPELASPWDLAAAVTEPPRWLPYSAWIGHVPFALWLVSVLRPATLVELGTFTGVSFCAFLQGMAPLASSRRAVAVDTWEGDAFTGAYSAEIHASLQAHCDPGLARLLRMRFDDALAEVPDGTVDLLHIDGSHTYDEVRHDFESWSPKLAPNAVVLLHDVAVRLGDFGVWRLWDELRRRHRTLTFDHWFGLGVLALGPAVAAPLDRLLAGPGEPPSREALAARALFEALASRFGPPPDLEPPPPPPEPPPRRFARTPANLWAFLTKRPLV